MKDTEKFKISKEMLDLQENVEGIYMCRGRIEGSHPVFIPPDSLLADKLIFQAHKNTLHGGVVLTVTKVRSNYWIPTLTKLTESVVKKCYSCKRFNSLPYPGVKLVPLQNDRTEQAMTFQAQILRVQFITVIKQRKNQKHTSLCFCAV